MRRVAATLVLASLVVLAGCGGASTGSPTSSPAESPTATPTATATPSPTPTSSLAAVEYPDGASESGFQDPSALASHQQAILNQTSFTLDYAFESVSGPDEGRTASLSTTYTPNNSLTKIQSSSNASLWTDETGTALKTSGGKQTQYAYFERNSSFVGNLYRNYGLKLTGQIVKQYSAAFNFEATGTFTEDGITYIQYESTGVNQTYVDRKRTTDYTAGNLTLVMRSDGLVTEIQGSTTVKTDTGESKRQATYEISSVGETTVDRPAWTDEKIPALKTELVADGKVLEITHTGGPDLGAGALTLRAGGVGKTRLSGLSEGDTVYVTATGDQELNLTVHDEQPTPDSDDVDLSSASNVVVQIQGGSVSLALLVHSEQSSARVV